MSCMAKLQNPPTRWAWVEVDLGALRRNTRAFKNLLKPRQKLCCVVKADAYGHGAVPCAKVMQSAGADMFAVATVLEGVALREGGIMAPILVLSQPPETAIDVLLDHALMPSVYTVEFALAYGEEAVRRGMVGRCILGTGININQRTFTGSAPNPVSLWQITGQETDRNQITDELLKRLEHYLDMVDTGRYGDIHDMYAGSLYRRNGVHAYRDAGGVFMARIERIEPDGRLVLHRTDGSLKEYMFKEVEHIITPCPTTTRQ